MSESLQQPSAALQNLHLIPVTSRCMCIVCACGVCIMCVYVCVVHVCGNMCV